MDFLGGYILSSFFAAKIMYEYFFDFLFLCRNIALGTFISREAFLGIDSKDDIVAFHSFSESNEEAAVSIIK